MTTSLVDSVSVEKLLRMLSSSLGKTADRVARGEIGVVLRELELLSLRQNPFATTDSYVAEWQGLFEKIWPGRKFDLSMVVVPIDKRGFERVIIVPQGLTLNEVIEVYNQRFTVNNMLESSLKPKIRHNQRTADNGSYAIRCRNSREPDEELAKKSLIEIDSSGKTTMTLLERLIFGLKYFDETDNHLDLKKVTLCSGSHVLYGGTLTVTWNGRRIDIGLFNPADWTPTVQAREVISLT